MSIVSLVHSAKFIVVLYRLCCIGYREFLRWSKFIFSGIDFLFANIKIILSKFQIGLCLSIA